MANFNWDEKYLGKKVIDQNGKVGEFISCTDKPTFTVEYNSGERVNAVIGSPMGNGWKLIQSLSEEIISLESVNCCDVASIRRKLKELKGKRFCEGYHNCDEFPKDCKNFMVKWEEIEKAFGYKLI